MAHDLNYTLGRKLYTILLFNLKLYCWAVNLAYPRVTLFVLYLHWWCYTTSCWICDSICCFILWTLTWYLLYKCSFSLVTWWKKTNTSVRLYLISNWLLCQILHTFMLKSYLTTWGMSLCLNSKIHRNTSFLFIELFGSNKWKCCQIMHIVQKKMDTAHPRVWRSGQQSGLRTMGFQVKILAETKHYVISFP